MDHLWGAVEGRAVDSPAVLRHDLLLAGKNNKKFIILFIAAFVIDPFDEDMIIICNRSIIW